MGSFLSWVFPSMGHAYAGNWRRGGYFVIAEISCLYIALSDYSAKPQGVLVKDDTISMASSLGLFGLLIWEKIDAYQEVEKYNNRIYKKIFGKEPPSFSLNLQPTYNGINLSLNYSIY